jgi:uncharacterized protein
VILPDVNVLVYAHRRDTEQHSLVRRWLEDVIAADEAYAMSDLVLSGFLRVVTHPRIFSEPSSLGDALAFVEQLLGQPNCILVHPGPRHWDIFVRLCAKASARGNLVPGAFLAALAIEAGCEWITTDGDFARFDGLRWRHPLR